MNRGNALQKIGDAPSRTAAVAAYDEAIAHFTTLSSTPAHRNHHGAAWLNRGHALLDHNRPEATRSFEQAIAILRELPFDENPAYRLNLAGAWTNLAHTEFASAPLRARASASTALSLVTAFAAYDLACAAMSLRARRALVMSLGELLHRGTGVPPVIPNLHGPDACATQSELANEATDALDALDAGLALARAWADRGSAQLRPLAIRLFRLGAQLYGTHQPHFLAEFLLENLAAAQSGAFAGDAEFRAIAEEALTRALAELQRPRLLTIDRPEAERLLATVRSLRAAQLRLSALSF